MRWAATLAALSLWSASAAEAAQCQSGTFETIPYTACQFDPSTDTLRFWHTDAAGGLIGSFERLSDITRADGQTLTFAMNGAMYHEDRAPVGLYIEDGEQISPIALRAGPGNFGLLPNGVFCLKDGTARIFESRAFDATGQDCDYAMQSGPLMVQGGQLHPDFTEGSRWRLIRNGFGVTPAGQVIAAIADAPINFHQFARLFRDVLGAPDALYVDGNVSRVYIPAQDRQDFGFPMGPIFGVIQSAD